MPGWKGSDRRTRLPREWHRLRAIAKRNAGGQCQWVEHDTRCPQPGTDCDHITAGDDHTPSNLQWLCRAHHLTKSGREGNAAKPSRLRPTEAHPGAL